MLKVLYIVEPMIGIGPNIDANLIAKTAIADFPNIDLTIFMDTQVPLRYTNKNVRWVKSAPWRYNPITKKLLDLNKKELDETFKIKRKDVCCIMASSGGLNITMGLYSSKYL